MNIPTKATLKKYGLTVEQYIALWDLTGGRCPLCLKKFNSNIAARRACIDHDHKTYRVRGLLCSSCNYEVGCLHDNDRWLDAAARYLRFPSADQIGFTALVAGAPVRENV